MRISHINLSHSEKVPPAYGMMIGALAGGLIGGADLIETTDLMIAGAKT